jgi:hypothetical protein
VVALVLAWAGCNGGEGPEVSALQQALLNGAGAYVATAETTTTGTKLNSTTYVHTQNDDGTPEQIQEKGTAAKMVQTWTIGSVSGTSFTMTVKAKKLEASGDDFSFGWGTASGGPFTTFCTITTADTSYKTCTQAVTVAAGTTALYVQVDDSDKSSGDATKNILHVDYVAAVPSGGGGDTTPPTDGATFTATGGALQVSLAWAAASDNVGVTSYKLVYAAGATAPATCAAGTQIGGTLTGLSYVHTGLAASTTYSYRVCALDAAGNVSTGKTASATTSAGADTTPPTDGATFTATGGTLQVSLAWAAASDNVGVVSYKLVYATGATAPATCAAGTQIGGTLTGLSYVHTGLAAGAAYSYRVCALDAAGNGSTGKTASATTSAAATVYVATAESSTYGTKLNGTTYVQTQADDGVAEQLAESGGSNSKKLNHIWTIDGLSGTSFTLTVKAKKLEGSGDVFSFGWGTASAGPFTTFCTVGTTDTAYKTCTQAVTVAAGTTALYVQVIDSTQSGDTTVNNLHVDYLAATGGGGGGGNCGNGVIDAGEQCDLAANNGQEGWCCTSACAFTAAGTICNELNRSRCTGASSLCPGLVYPGAGAACQ